MDGRGLLTGLAVDGFAQEVGVAVVPCVLLDQVEQDPAQAGRPSVRKSTDGESVETAVGESFVDPLP